jgi:hypothetical protein
MGERLYQFVDILVAGAIAGITTFVWALALPPGLALTVGAIFSSMWYFSRNPWGSTRGDEYNEWIDDLYDRFLP